MSWQVKKAEEKCPGKQEKAEDEAVERKKLKRNVLVRKKIRRQKYAEKDCPGLRRNVLRRKKS
jgi:hypothetical protein